MAHTNGTMRKSDNACWTFRLAIIMCRPSINICLVVAMRVGWLVGWSVSNHVQSVCKVTDCFASFAMAFTFCRRKPCSSDGTIVIRNESCLVTMIVSNQIDDCSCKITEHARRPRRLVHVLLPRQQYVENREEAKRAYHRGRRVKPTVRTAHDAQHPSQQSRKSTSFSTFCSMQNQTFQTTSQTSDVDGSDGLKLRLPRMASPSIQACSD